VNDDRSKNWLYSIKSCYH